jgi:hypothetical protein
MKEQMRGKHQKTRQERLISLEVAQDVQPREGLTDPHRYPMVSSLYEFPIRVSREERRSGAAESHLFIPNLDSDLLTFFQTEILSWKTGGDFSCSGTIFSFAFTARKGERGQEIETERER